MLSFQRVFIIIALSNTIWACSSTAKKSTYDAYRITRAEAETYACPKFLMKAGASPTDCKCITEKLYILGQDSRSIAISQQLAYEASEHQNDERSVAIGMFSYQAQKACGLFEERHPVNKALSLSLTIPNIR